MLTLAPHPDGWALLVDGDRSEPAWVVRKKATCLASAKNAARELGCTLRVLDRRGRTQREFGFTTAATGGAHAA